MESQILVVDDEESIRYTFNEFLSEQGYAVTCAASYDEAASQLGKTDFDLIYADIVLEGKTGIDLLRTVRQDRPAVPVIMINGRHDHLFTYENSQLRMLELLGTPDKDKKHLVFEEGHFDFPRNTVAREVSDWLDQHMGPVR